ncbi:MULTISPECIES: histidine phosphatase family protein [Pantoea]|jgi:broad specificity phosphatase PhoE|uniref:histidine phosphatase family protein n=1 Tax=Pantoea TaxID=53335 RepID=UPI0012F74494|nr:histidine phosphatase family protein [Pantoea agglomerans]MDY0993720.1 histidine phosphatase family protein [Pantoea agglomerans]MVT81716.1 histidine phosphatase family protein [Pantoea agglomerans]NYB29336.1 histidine phosphatase family protein [Pantoea agglomerans]WNK43916.1 histidine phosphatase family protein [Pantoea agglomerans]WNK57649.1 histidine phosphatase family protein [Pantoea agglomerans]
MKIILMRHGKPDHQAAGRQSVQALADWCEAYDLSQVSDGPPPRSIEIARQAAVIVCSPLPRAQSSLSQLGLQPHEVDAVFSEVAVPLLRTGAVQLPTLCWLALLRLLWFCGYAGEAESLQHARSRASAAAEKLIDHSRHGTVLLLGHGIMNKMIARELRKRGWQAEKHASSRHWSSAIYHRPFI